MAEQRESTSAIVAPAALDDLIAALAPAAIACSGRRVRDGAIVYDDLDSGPSCRSAGPTSRTAARYRLERRDGRGALRLRGRAALVEALPVPAAGALWRAAPGRGRRPRHRGGADRRRRRSRFIGVRALRAARDRDPGPVFLGGRHVDRDYAARRDGAFLVAVNCFEPAATCFCTSMGTGPRSRIGYDLVLTELLDGEHRLLVEAGSERGAEVLAELPRPAGRRRGPRAADASIEHGAASRMGRTHGHAVTSAICCRATSSTRAGTRSPRAA